MFLMNLMEHGVPATVTTDEDTVTTGERWSGGVCRLSSVVRCQFHVDVVIAQLLLSAEC